MHYFYTHAAGALIPAEGRAAHVPVVDAIGVVGGGLGGAWLGYRRVGVRARAWGRARVRVLGLGL